MASPWSIDGWDMMLRLLSAVLLGGIIGMEREHSNHAAGFRTHILVCLGSALIMLLSIYGFSAFANEPNVQMDPARLAAQVISGIGFLGAGTILRHGLSVSGLTTAASLWVVAAIGLSVGAGFYVPAILTTLLVLVSLIVLNKVEKKWFQRNRMFFIKLKVSDRPGVLREVSSLLESRRIEIRKMITDRDDREEGMFELTLHVKVPRPQRIVDVMNELMNLEHVHSAAYE